MPSNKAEIVLLDDATNQTLSRTRLKILSHTLVDLLNSLFISQCTLSQRAMGTEISPAKHAESLVDILVGGLVNTNKNRPIRLPHYKKPAKRTALVSE